MVLMTFVIMSIFLVFQTLYIVVPIMVKPKINEITDINNRGMSVIIPAYNEELVIINCIKASMQVQYDDMEILIINDGSKDSTMSILKDYLKLEVDFRKKADILNHKMVKQVYKSKLYTNIFVIDKENGGKADAINVGIEYAKKEIVVTLDADSMLEKNSLKHINSYFSNEDVVAAGGTVLVVQGFEKGENGVRLSFGGPGIVKHQILHYIHGFYIKKMTQSQFNSMTVISGAFGAFKRDILLKVDGFRNTVGEDMDITLKIYQYIKINKLNKKLVYAPEAVCYTECPQNLDNFFKQRFRWQKAFTDCIVEYWGKLFNEFDKAVSYFLSLDSLLLGTISAFLSLVVPIMILMDGRGYILALVLFLISTIFDFTQTILSLVIAARYGYKFSFKDYIKIGIFMIYERVTYKLLPLVINTWGTAKYFIEEDKWEYVERKGEVSIV